LNDELPFGTFAARTSVPVFTDMRFFIKQTCARNILHYDFNIYRTRKAGIDCGHRPALL